MFTVQGEWALSAPLATATKRITTSYMMHRLDLIIVSDMNMQANR